MLFPKEDGPKDALMVANLLEASEGLSRDFQYTIEVLSDNPDIAHKDVLGKMVTLTPGMIEIQSTLVKINC